MKQNLLIGGLVHQIKDIYFPSDIINLIHFFIQIFPKFDPSHNNEYFKITEQGTMVSGTGRWSLSG